MTFSDDDRAIARQLCKEKATLELLLRVFAPSIEDFGGDLKQNVVALDDAEYGKMMKMLHISREHFIAKVLVLKKLGAGHSTERTGIPRAPK